MLVNPDKQWLTSNGAEENSKGNGSSNCGEQLPPLGAEIKAKKKEKHKDHESESQTSKGNFKAVVRPPLPPV